MLKRLFLLVSIAGLSLLNTVLPSKASASISGVPPEIDPTIVTTDRLTSNPLLDQGMDMPNGLYLIAPTDYSTYVNAKGPDGSIYFAEYSGSIKQVLPDFEGKLSLFSPVRTIVSGLTGVFGITVDAGGNLFYGIDGYNGTAHVEWRKPNGDSIIIMSGLTAPRQLTVDQQGNVYVVEEAGNVRKWDRATGQVTLIASNLWSPQGIAIAANGDIFIQEYSKHSNNPLIGVGYQGGKLKKIKSDGTVEVVAGGTVTDLWRGRGLAINSEGKLYAVGEGNAWDQGNSSALNLYDPTTGSFTRLYNGLDYVTFPTFGNDQRLYMTMVRDRFLAAWDPAASFNEQAWTNIRGSRVITNGGTWVGSDSNIANLSIQIDDLALQGTVASSTSAKRVSGWIKVPSSSLPNVVKTVWAHPPAPLPGLMNLPKIDCQAKEGTCAVAVIPLREHVRSRWPMIDMYTAAADFSEAAEAYMVYFEWTPNHVPPYIDDSIYQPSFKGDSFDIYQGNHVKWTYQGNWQPAGQTWNNAGKVDVEKSLNNTAEMDLSQYAGQSKYVYVTWHKAKDWRDDSVRYLLYDDNQVLADATLDQRFHANGQNLQDDTFAGWKQIGNGPIAITSTTKLKVMHTGTILPNEYLQNDAVMLSDNLVIDNTSLGATNSFERNPALSVNSVGLRGIGHHWSMQGLGYQSTSDSSKEYIVSPSASSGVSLKEGFYYVDVSWDYTDVPKFATRATYSVNAIDAAVVNQNLRADRQGMVFSQGNSVGSWSGFYRLPGIYLNSDDAPIEVKLHNDVNSGGELVADMVRFVPITSLTGPEFVEAVVKQMKANSKAWQGASVADRIKLLKANQKLGELINAK